MKQIRTLVIDDEPLARARIIKLLQQYDYVCVLAECKNGKEATKAISTYQPDLIFLDIQMPDFNGFDVIEKLKIKPIPFIIFVTAFGQYALKAFDIHAVDYLLKPFDNERFEKALVHARQQIHLKENEHLHQKMTKLLQKFDPNTNDTLQQIQLKEKGRFISINVYDIYWIETNGNYLKLYLEKEKYLYRKTMLEIENELDNTIFLRIHRSILVNNLCIEKIQYKGNKLYTIILKNKTELISSRTYKDDIDSFLEDKEMML